MSEEIQTLAFNNIESLLKEGKVNYYNVYNLDMNLPSYFAVKYYLDNPHDSVDMKQDISTLFLDIEVFTDNKGLENFKNAICPISCVSILLNKSNIIESYLLLLNRNYDKYGLKDVEDYDKFLVERANSFIDTLYKEKYLLEDGYSINIHIYADEKQMLLDLWQKIHELDPATLSGWNSSTFDIPYIYNRIAVLLGSTVAADRVVSKFGSVKTYGETINIPEFANTDLLYLYRPRDEMGLGFSPY